MKKIVINLTGKNGCGKDTSARLIKELCEFSYFVDSEIISIADPIKQVCSILTNEPLSNFNDRIKKESKLDNLDITRRDFMVEFTKKTMELDNNIYWKLTYSKIKNSKAKLIVITDCRFLEWLEFLENTNEVDSCIFQIDRDNCITQYLPIDVSSLKQCPVFHVDNNRDQHSLKVQLDFLLYNLLVV